MDFDFTPYFEKYERLVATADAAFERVKNAYAACVQCRQGCADCCHAIFDLTFIEALYLNHCFKQKVAGADRERILEASNRFDRELARIKRRAAQALKAGRSEEEILTELAAERLRCPLLNDRELCDLYENRPITCRFYGIPTAIRGAGHTCGRSGFEPGESYPTVKLDAVLARLQEISAELVLALKSRHIGLADLLVPVSSALINAYDEEYLGLKAPEPSPPRSTKKKRRRTL